MHPCAVCGKHTPDLASGATLVRCANPACQHHVCTRHGLVYEIHDARDSSLNYYCSRRCWREVHRRALPLAQELAIAALLLLLVIPLYLYVVSLFT